MPSGPSVAARMRSRAARMDCRRCFLFRIKRAPQNEAATPSKKPISNICSMAPQHVARIAADQSLRPACQHDGRQCAAQQSRDHRPERHKRQRQTPRPPPSQGSIETPRPEAAIPYTTLSSPRYRRCSAWCSSPHPASPARRHASQRLLRRRSMVTIRPARRRAMRHPVRAPAHHKSRSGCPS